MRHACLKSRFCQKCQRESSTIFGQHSSRTRSMLRSPASRTPVGLRSPAHTHFTWWIGPIQRPLGAGRVHRWRGFPGRAWRPLLGARRGPVFLDEVPLPRQVAPKGWQVVCSELSLTQDLWTVLSTSTSSSGCATAKRSTRCSWCPRWWRSAHLHDQVVVPGPDHRAIPLCGALCSTPGSHGERGILSPLPVELWWWTRLRLWTFCQQ